MTDLSSYENKKVFLTGHTGFKGTWMIVLLRCLGAKVTGYALAPPTRPSLFALLEMQKEMSSIEGDIRDLDTLAETMRRVKPDIVIHMAAQPIVRESYRDPVGTYETNVMGTVNVLEAVRRTGGVRSVVNVTTDKVYQNNEWLWPYRETDELNGYDPYSNSKSCSELVTSSFRNSFFADGETRISTARAGNVIGGGDFAADRMVPDCVRAAIAGKEIIVRNPYSVRPYQHVLEPVTAYLRIAQAQYENKEYAGSYNIGPDQEDCIATGKLADLFCEEWGGITWKNVGEEDAVHEANLLKLDCSKAKSVLGIEPVWHIKTAVQKVVEWTRCYVEGGDLKRCVEEQIRDYLNGKSDMHKSV